MLLVSSCSSLGYLAHTTSGHLQLMSQRQPIKTLLNDDAIQKKQKQTLNTILRMREFASRDLLLPDNKSYTSYVEIDRDYVTWVVFAAEKYSLQAKQWCFWVIGCVPYRGYFDKDKALSFSAKLENQGYEVYLAPVPAYSTLGWFSDPVLSSMVNRGQVTLAEYIFHELAHQKLYIKNDAKFNEAFATSVAQIGVSQWLTHEGRKQATQTYLQTQRHKQEIYTIIDDLKRLLKAIYMSSVDTNIKQQKKTQAFDNYQQEMSRKLYALNKYKEYETWLLHGMNNAKLNAYATYQELVPKFMNLYQRCNNDLRKFYSAVEDMQNLSEQQRRVALESGQC